VKRIVACCGKVYYDLVFKEPSFKGTDTAIIRVEQLYPFPHKQFEAEVKRYPECDRGGVVPGRAADQGAWYPDRALLQGEHARRAEALLRGRAAVRGACYRLHGAPQRRQKQLVEQAFGKYK
jgi:2-oxoglutarate dehydrogenase E1 component